jgi:TRAP-type mannitol/chloroaromatic compound transport system permease large subunit
LILNFFFLVVGFFLHSAAAIILVIPILIPLITAAGIDPVHFGLVVTLNLPIGQQIPPRGIGADHGVFSCARQYLGGVQGQHLVCWGAYFGFDIMYLCAICANVSCGVFLPLTLSSPALQLIRSART